MTTISKANSLSRHFSTASLKELPVRSFLQPKLTSLDAEALYSQLLDKPCDIKILKKIHLKIALDASLRSITSLAIKLMRAYSACGQPKVSRQVFDGISDKNIVVCNVMVRSYMNNQRYQDALFLFKNLYFHLVMPDRFTFPCVLKACSGLVNVRVGFQVHTPILKLGLDTNLFIGNGLVAMYGKCKFGVEARQVLDEMPCRDVVSWNSMVSGYAQNGLFDDALQVCKEMRFLGIRPNSGTMASLSPAVSNTSKANVEFMRDMFVHMVRDELVSWNVMISVYVTSSMPYEAVEMYLQMEACGILPDVVTIASILPACGDLSAVSLGRRIHEYIERRGFCPNLSLENALVDMYAKCGCISEARKVFDNMRFRDVVSWTSMISAYGMTGQGRDAVALFSKLRDSGIPPDSIAFVSVLSACSHAGLVDEGRYYYRLMVNDYKIAPRLEHMACMVDLLGRAGRVDEAYNFIQEMPLEPNDRVWGALLSACRIYNNMIIGVIAADRLFNLAPEKSGYYVLLSNMYAKAGRWKDVTTIRKMMKGKGIKKTPGLTHVEVNKQIYTFLAGDKSNPQAKMIYEELDLLVGKMKEIGYIPEIDEALHDVEVEDKEYHLTVHGEKLAIVFALMNTEPGTTIRITKNLRICGDCHTAAKFMSMVTEREIVVRDTNRYHHIRDGACSCGDYW